MNGRTRWEFFYYNCRKYPWDANWPATHGLVRSLSVASINPFDSLRAQPLVPGSTNIGSRRSRRMLTKHLLKAS